MIPVGFVCFWFTHCVSPVSDQMKRRVLGTSEDQRRAMSWIIFPLNTSDCGYLLWTQSIGPKMDSFWSAAVDFIITNVTEKTAGWWSCWCVTFQTAGESGFHRFLQLCIYQKNITGFKPSDAHVSVTQHSCYFHLTEIIYSLVCNNFKIHMEIF